MDYHTEFVDRINGRGAIDAKVEIVKEEMLVSSNLSLSDLSEISDGESSD